MQTLKLVIGSKNSSSWSLRPWLLLKQVGLSFDEVVIPLLRPDAPDRIREYSPSGKVPVLIVGDVKIWDSLAICEFLAEYDPSLWPADSRARAIARSVSAEMHSGFSAMRTFLPMDFTARFGPPGRLLRAVQDDIDRIVAIWSECRYHYGAGGPFLFGPFTIADAMFAPVCSRLVTYAIPVAGLAAAYVDTMMRLPAMQEWGHGALAEVNGRPVASQPELARPQASPRPPSPSAEPPRARANEPERLPPTFAPELVLADPKPKAPAPAPTPPVERRPPAPHDAPEDIRRALRPAPSSVIIKPIGDHSQRRKT